jgi:large subunit ribosomal protein L13
MAKSNEVSQSWHLVDAEGKVLGRLAVELAKILMGKNKPEYTPHVDTGDYIVVINAEKIKLTGKKMDTMYYEWFTGYPGGQKQRPIKEMLAKNPTEVVRLAVRRMLPKTKLGRQFLSKLKIYVGPRHDHQAQQPKKLEINTCSK